MNSFPIDGTMKKYVVRSLIIFGTVPIVDKTEAMATPTTFYAYR